MRDIQRVLELWSGWAVSYRLDIYYSSIAPGFKELLPKTSNTRPCCTDDDALIIEGCLARLKEKRPYEYELIVLHYLYRFSKRKIAKHQKKDEKLIRIEIQMAEGFIEGCLSMLNVKLNCEV
ncbi:antitermination protein Q [Cronobacter sakazakii]|nr:antitermination protein Q [Cronobacter turicensis]ELY4469879.1 antitermination protein Q [Cronobacter sakazakii]ELY4587383.1 antitermination protein Q [Cronobacter sakazakii]